MVSVRHGEGTELSSTRLGLEGREAVLGHGPSSVVYAIVDRVVDTYEEVVGQLEIDMRRLREPLRAAFGSETRGTVSNDGTR